MFIAALLCLTSCSWKNAKLIKSSLFRVLYEHFLTPLSKLFGNFFLRYFHLNSQILLVLNDREIKYEIKLKNYYFISLLFQRAFGHNELLMMSSRWV